MTVTLPALGRSRDRAQCVTDSFERMRERLADHEERHATLAIEGARLIAVALGEIPERESCEDLRRAWADAGRRELSAMNARQAQYDAATGHGLSEGVKLEPCP